jgi:DNA-binding winged helix-turn-helix (wHTH) protein
MSTIGSQEPVAYKFGPFVLYTRELHLLRDGEVVSAAPKVLETLAILVERAGDVVSRSEIIARVWPNVFVEEGSLAQNIFQLRRLLDKEFPNQQVIATLPKRGYTFVPRVALIQATAERQATVTAPVEVPPPLTPEAFRSSTDMEEKSPEISSLVSSPPELPQDRVQPRRSSSFALLLPQRIRRSWIPPYALALALIVASAAAAVLSDRRAGSHPESADSRRSVLVLAFDALESSAGESLHRLKLADSLRENLIHNGRVRVLQTKPSPEWLPHHAVGKPAMLTRDDLHELREATGCDLVVVAQVEGSDEQIGLSALVYDAGSGKIIGSFDHSGPGAQLPVLVNRVNTKIGGLLEGSTGLP